MKGQKHVKLWVFSTRGCYLVYKSVLFMIESIYDWLVRIQSGLELMTICHLLIFSKHSSSVLNHYSFSVLRD